MGFNLAFFYVFAAVAVVLLMVVPLKRLSVSVPSAI